MQIERSLPIAFERVEMRSMGSETLVHDAEHHKVHVLNSTAARILQMCDGTRDVDEIAGSLSSQTGQPRERVLRDVAGALEVFLDLKLIRYP